MIEILWKADKTVSYKYDINMLIHNCDYFKVMFNGNFSETCEDMMKHTNVRSQMNG